MRNTYTYAPATDTTGSSLAVLLTPSQQKTVETFEPVEAFKDDKKGYDGLAWVFVDGDGRFFNCYRRFGSMRLGVKSPRFSPCGKLEESTPVDGFLSYLDDIGELFRWVPPAALADAPEFSGVCGDGGSGNA